MKHFRYFCKPYFTLGTASRRFIFLAICVSSTCSYAASQEFHRCIKEGIKFDYECAKLEYEHHSHRLKAALDALLNLRHINKQDIQKQQNKWIKYRQDTCLKSTNADNTFAYWQDCLARVTESRANEIEKMAKKH